MTGDFASTGAGARAGEVSFEPLTPTAFLDRSAIVFADRTAVIDGDRRFSYGHFHERCLRQAGALASLGVAPGDRVAVLAPNTSLLLEAHYGVLYAGGVLVALNVRLSAAELAYIVEHAACRVLLHDPYLGDIARSIARGVDGGLRLISGGEAYEQLLAGARPQRVAVADETALMALNYTSGTTGQPKGVMYHHRGAYLQALAMTTHFQMGSGSVYLWTLPMFHCNGWCFTWAVTAAGATHVCLPRPEPERVWQLIYGEGVTHLCAAPTVLVSLAHFAGAAPPGHHVVAATGGAPPSPALLERCAELGLSVTHLYGLTESFGPAVICDWRSEWDGLSAADQAVLRARQGVGNVISCAVRVLGDAGRDVPRDGETMGEVALRGNNIMLGYYRDEAATEAVVRDGWFHTGDLGVLHPNGYLEIRDRAKDVIISGGENISSVEVEAALASHPAVLECAVFAVPDERWGERPMALVTLKHSHEASPEELRDHVRARLASFKIPDRIEFGPLPKTATGKIRKFELREATWAGKTRVGAAGVKQKDTEHRSAGPARSSDPSHDQPPASLGSAGPAAADRGHGPRSGMPRQ